MSDVAKTPREELECKKKYLYEYSMFWECNDGSKCQILEEDVCDLLNKLYEENEKLRFLIDINSVSEVRKLERQVDEQQDTINKQLDQIIELQDKYRILEFNHSRLEKRNKAQYEKIDEQQAEIERLKEQLSLVCKAESSSPYNSVKEVLRRQIFGLDCAAQESANAWNHYCVLSKLFEEQYGEYWDNFD